MWFLVSLNLIVALYKSVVYMKSSRNLTASRSRYVGKIDLTTNVLAASMKSLVRTTILCCHLFAQNRQKSLNMLYLVSTSDS